MFSSGYVPVQDRTYNPGKKFNGSYIFY